MTGAIVGATSAIVGVTSAIVGVTGAIVDTSRLAKMIGYSLAAGIGITTVFALGVTSWGSMVDALRRRHSGAGAMWAGLTLVCLLVSGGAIALGLIVMSSKS